MMGSKFWSFSILFMVLFAASFISVTSAVGGESFIPPVPDKTKILPANNGGPDGCDSSRFKCVIGGEAILDNQTGLVWARDAQILGKKVSWEEAVNYCESMDLGGKKGWRLPTRDELIALLDTSQSEPALPEGHPFLKIKDLATATGSGRSGGYQYWTSTIFEDDNERVWMVSFKAGYVMDSLKLLDLTIWPVRDGE